MYCVTRRRVASRHAYDSTTSNSALKKRQTKSRRRIQNGRIRLRLCRLVSSSQCASPVSTVSPVPHGSTASTGVARRRPISSVSTVCQLARVVRNPLFHPLQPFQPFHPPQDYIHFQPFHPFLFVSTVRLG